MEIEQSYLDQPDAMPEAFAQAWNARDAVALAALFDAEAEFVNVVGLWWHDRGAIWKAHDYGLRVIFPESTLRVTRAQVKRLTDDVALVHGRMRLTGQSAHAKASAPGPRRNMFTFVMQRKGSGWVCVAAHNTDIVLGAETHVVGDDGKLATADYRR